MDVRGTVAEGFEPVEDAFIRNFEQRGERGAAVAVYRDGRKVVDLWAGTRAVDRHEPWAVDTAQVVRSATKGVAAAVVLLLHQRGQIDLDAPVGTYWPQFKAAGPDRVLVVPTRFGLGYMLHGPSSPLLGPGSFDHPGRGGSLGFADPESGIALGYVTNGMRKGVTADPRAQALIRAVRSAI